MSTDIVPFHFQGSEVRTLTVEGEPWFVAVDLLNELDLDRTALRRLDEDERGVASIPTLGGAQSATIVNEPGLYSLILGSRKPEAKAFKRWITHEVLPAIRKTGSYSVEAVESPEQFLARALTVATGVLAQKDEAILELTPRAEAWDELASAHGDYSVGDAAKILARGGIPTGPNRLFEQLHGIKWTFRGEGGKWRAYAERVDKGHLAELPQKHYHPKTGVLVLDPPQLRVTVKGLERLRQRLNPTALKAVSE